jgi:hypothetical protein
VFRHASKVRVKLRTLLQGDPHRPGSRGDNAVDDGVMEHPVLPRTNRDRAEAAPLERSKVTDPPASPRASAVCTKPTVRRRRPAAPFDADLLEYVTRAQMVGDVLTRGTRLPREVGSRERKRIHLLESLDPFHLNLACGFEPEVPGRRHQRMNQRGDDDFAPFR